MLKDESLNIKEPRSNMAHSEFENNFSIPEELADEESSNRQKFKPEELFTQYPPASSDPPNGLRYSVMMSLYNSGDLAPIKSKLERASYSGQTLSSLPTDLFIMENIGELDLSKNCLARVRPPSHVMTMHKIGRTLLRLNLSHNYLLSIESSVIAPLIVLESLDLSYNLLQDISTVCCLYTLRSLNILRNRIMVIGPQLRDLRSLEVLTFDWPTLISPDVNTAVISMSSRHMNTQQSVLDLTAFLEKLNDPYSVYTFFADYTSHDLPILSFNAFGKSSIANDNLCTFSLVLEQHQVLLQLASLQQPESGILDICFNQDKPKPILTVLGKIPPSTAQKLGSLIFARALQHKKAEIIRAISAFPLQIDWTDRKGNTLLHLAFMDHSIDFKDRQLLIRELVLTHKMDPDKQNFDGYSTIGFMFSQNKFLYNLLIALDFNSAVRDHRFYSDYTFNLLIVDETSNSVLHYIALKPNLNVIFQILKYSPEMALAINDSCQIPLWIVPHTFLTSKKILVQVTKSQYSGTLAIRANPLDYRTGFKAGAGRFLNSVPPKPLPPPNLNPQLMFPPNDPSIKERNVDSLYHNAIIDYNKALEARMSTQNFSFFSMLEDRDKARETNRRIYRDMAKQNLKELYKAKPGTTARSLGPKKFINQLNSPRPDLNTASEDRFGMVKTSAFGQIDSWLSSIKGKKPSELIRTFCLIISAIGDRRTKIEMINKLLAVYSEATPNHEYSSFTPEVRNSKLCLYTVAGCLDMLYQRSSVSN